MNILTPWIAIFIVGLCVSAVGTYWQREGKKRRQRRAKLAAAGLHGSASAATATNFTPTEGKASYIKTGQTAVGRFH